MACDKAGEMPRASFSQRADRLNVAAELKAVYGIEEQELHL